MPAHCHVCRRAFPTRDPSSPLPGGRRLAFDPERGRLWVVCAECGEWNLTAIETRWEAIAECERRFAAAEARASSVNVGLARSGDVELVRVGAALRDELANWRYGPRLRRRHRRASRLVIAAGVAAGTTIGALVLAAPLLQRSMFQLWLAAAGAALLWPLTGWLRQRAARARDVRFTDATGRRLRIPRRRLPWMRIARHSKRSGVLRVHVMMPLDQPDHDLDGESTLLMLHEALPRLNWQGATSEETARATEIVDEAEAVVASARARGAPTGAPWETIAVRHWAGKGDIGRMPTDARLALEMAVTEELERRALASEAAALADAARDAEEVAGIADDLLLPRFVTEWLDRHRRLAPAAVTASRVAASRGAASRGAADPEEAPPERRGRRSARTRR